MNATHTHCPHKTCTFSFPTIKGVQGQLRQHLTTMHTLEQNLQLNQTHLHKLHVFPCQQCHSIFASLDKCKRHQQNTHPTTRSQTNLEIILRTFPTQDKQPKHQQHIRERWSLTLLWLTKLEIHPPTSRNTLYHQLHPPHKKIVFAILAQLISWTNQAMLPYDANNKTVLPACQTTATPFLKLLFMFESLFLSHPNNSQNTQKISYGQLLQQRHTLFRQGDLQSLYEQTRQSVDTPITQQHTIPLFDDLQHSRAAQHAADNDNLQTAFNRIKSVTPQVALSPHYLSLLRKLYPPQTPFPVTTTRTTNRQQTPWQPISSKLILKTLQKQKRGTAPGPFADSIDLFRDFATYTTHRSNLTYPYLESFSTLINSFAANKTPTDIQETFAAQYVIALHKDPKNLDKIRPIGIGTALRRITAATLMTAHGPTIADFLVPHGQMGIAIPGGLDFIVHSTQAQIQTYITTHQRALITLDIENMFNAISRQACRHTIIQEPTLQPLCPYFDLLYSKSNLCWYQTPERQYLNFPQQEGFTQGCPLSGAFADIVLTLVLQPINEQMEQRILARDPTAHPPRTLSYHDDTSAIVPYPDIKWFLDTFQQLGNPLGISLNLHKTQILTTLSDQHPPLSLSDQTHLDTILHIYFSSRTTQRHPATRPTGGRKGLHKRFY